MAFAVRKTVLVGPLAVIRVELAGGQFRQPPSALARFLQKVGRGVAYLLIVDSGGLDACRRFEAFPRIADGSLYEPGEDPRTLVPGSRVFERRPEDRNPLPAGKGHGERNEHQAGAQNTRLSSVTHSLRFAANHNLQTG